MNKERCSVPECGRTVRRRGLCKGHYQRLLECGDVQAHVPLPRAGKSIEGYSPRYEIENAYKTIYVPGHFSAWANGSVFEHIYVMCEHLGRPLHPNESVHHINGQRADNRIENLELWSSSQPAGQRVEDKVAWALELLKTYQPESLCSQGS